MNRAFKNAKVIKHQLSVIFRQNLSFKTQMTVLFFVTGFTMYAVFFSTTPAVHDFFHHLRHSMAIIPCH